MANGCMQESFGFATIDARQDDETRVDGFGCDESAEIAGIGRDEDKTLINAALKDNVVGLTQAAEIAGMFGKVLALPVDRTCDGRREALVQEELHRKEGWTSGRGFPGPAGGAAPEGMAPGVERGGLERPTVDAGIILDKVFNGLSALKTPKDGIDGDPRSPDDGGAAQDIGIGMDEGRTVAKVPVG